MTGRICKTLTLAERIEVLKRLERKESQSSIALEFGVNQSQISRILKNKDKLTEEWQNNNNPNRKRKRSGKCEDIEHALLRWFSQTRSRQIPVSGPILKEKANQLANDFAVTDFKATSGWLERWKSRNAINFKNDRKQTQAVITSGADRWVTEILPELFKDHNPRDIFNVAETALYWRALPSNTFLSKGTQINDCQTFRDRLTVLLACNMNGSEKLDAIIIGRKSPQCFNNVKKLPVNYMSNKNAYMTSEIWKDWLKQVDSDMRFNERNIIMVCDSCSAHVTNLELTNIRLVFLPPNTTPLVQPMHQGIIFNFKRLYRSIILHHLVFEVDIQSPECGIAQLSRNISLMDALHMTREAWNKITTTSITNSFRRANFVTRKSDDSNVEFDDDGETEIYLPSCMTADDFDRYVAMDDNLPTEEASDLSVVHFPFQTSHLEEGKASDDDEDVKEEEVSYAEVVDSLKTIRRFMEQRGCHTYEPLYELESIAHGLNCHDVVQTLIKDFFLPS